jgi:hypothetical protein
MGLDAFRTGDTSSKSSETENDSTEDENKSTTEDKTTTKSKTQTKDRPYFTVVKDTELRNITTHKDKNAFPPRGRFRSERIIQTIQSEEQYKRLNQKSKEHHSVGLPQLFKQNHALAKDFVERLSVSNDKTEDPTCDVCESTIDITKGNYTKVDDSIVHGDHNILNVVQSLEINDYGT